MKRNFKVLPVMLAVLIVVLSLPVVSFAATEEKSIEGDSTVNDVTLKVTVPSNLDFALDPLELNVTSGSQVATTDYFFVNRTAAPVKIAVNLTAVPADGVDLVDDPDTLSPYDTEVTDKEIYFGVLGATSITVNDLDFDYSASEEGATAPKGIYSTTSSALTYFSSSSKKADVAFALDKATNVKTNGDPDTGAALAAGNKGVASFQFYSKMNTYANWQPNDITVTGSYTLTALSGTTYSNYTTNNSYETGGLNQLKVDTAVKVSAITVTSTAVSVINGGHLQMTAEVTPEDATDKSVTWSVENGTGTATISAGGELTATGAGTVTVVATADDGSGVTGELEITVTTPVIGFTDEGGTATSSVTKAITVGNAPAGGFTFGFYYGGATITSFKTAGGTALVEGVDYTKTENSFTITQSRLQTIASTGLKTYPIVLSNGTTYTINIQAN